MLKKMSLLIFALFVFSACVFAQTPAPTPPEKPYGRAMTAKDVEGIEAELRKNPKDADNRKSLIDYYLEKGDEESKKSLQRHRRLFVQHSPEAHYLYQLGEWSLDEDKTKPEFLELKNEWLKQVELNRNNSNIRLNAVQFVKTLEPELAEKLLRDGQTIDADNYKYSDELIELYETNLKNLNIAYDAKEENVQLADIDKATVKLLTEAERRLTDMEKDAEAKYTGERMDLLVKLTKISLETNDLKKARTFAETIARDFIDAEPSYTDNEAIFYANNLLGRIALREGNTAKAKEHLLKSVTLFEGGSWTIEEPELDFPAELLGKGEKAAVLDYLQRAQKFTTDLFASRMLRRWERKLNRNLMPLVYDSDIY